MARTSAKLVFAMICTAVLSAVSSAQAPSPTPVASLTPNHRPCPAYSIDKSKPEKRFFKNILYDQCVIWTSPTRLGADDIKFVIPLAAATGALMTLDRRASSHVGTRGDLPPVSRAVSIGGSVYATAGIAGAFYLAGAATSNKKARETGVLAAQSLVNATIVTSVLKRTFRRSRPNEDDGSGNFFNAGSSFPSGHATSIWSVATVVAYEYKCKPWVPIAAYASAAAVSLSRVSARKHFMSDILVGSAIGFYTGRYVYRTYSADAGTKCDGSAAKTTSRLAPAIMPFYEPRTRTYGARFVWNP